ncbi:MAG: hypothetical protein CL674_05735 [Bdellovibrionaceae bacterium]|nr:hypothetical protein [Pseudobdellovibrionaceae bacterium]|tara:strand:+ start:119892 stop:120629 length:738 start_codon:yes stop_codon:yes gene_type:complete
MIKYVFASLLLLQTGGLWAETYQKRDDGYFKIKSFSIIEISQDEQELHYNNLNNRPPFYPLPVFPIPKPTQPSNDPKIQKSPISVIGDFISIGAKIWKIIEANRPVVDINTNYYSVLPKTVSSPSELSGWSKPEQRTFMITYENLFGMEVVKFVYRVFYSHSGSLNGKGAYIANAGIIPTHLELAWGYNFTAFNQISLPTNIGSKDQPIANIEMSLNWSIETVVKAEHRRVIAVIDGTGAMEFYQ